MTVVNLFPRKLDIRIGGKDFTNEYVVFEVGDEKISKAITARGSLTLRYTYNTDETLNPRYNQRWQRGTLVEIDIENDDGEMERHPRGMLRIESSTFDVATQTLNLSLTCLLGLLMAMDSNNDDNSACAHDEGGGGVGGSSVRGAVSSLTGKATARVGDANGVLVGQIPGTLLITSTGAGSGINHAIELAFSNGRLLWTDRNENFVSISSIGIGGIALTSLNVLNDLQGFEYLNTGDVPARIYKVTGQVRTIKSKRGCVFITRNISSGTGTATQETTIQECYFWNQYKRKKITKTLEQTGAVYPFLYAEPWMQTGLTFSERIEEEDIFDFPRRISFGGCTEPVDAILRKRIVTVYQPYGKVLSEWITQHDLDEFGNIVLESSTGGIGTVFTDYGIVIIARRETTEYLHKKKLPTSENPDDPPSLEVAKIISVVEEPYGVIFPRGFKLLGDGAGRTEAILADSGKRIQQWIERYKPDEYIYSEETFESLARLKSEAANLVRDKVEAGEMAVPSRYYAQLLKKEEKFETSNSGSTQPPAPETFPSSKEIITKEEEIKIYVPSRYPTPFNDEEVEISIPLGDRIEDDRGWKAKANTMARHMAMLAWGRYRGARIDCAFTNEWIRGYRPLRRVTLSEPDWFSQENKIVNYLIEGTNFVHTKTECIIGTDLLWDGEVISTRLVPLKVTAGLIPAEPIAVGTAIAIPVPGASDVLVEVPITLETTDRVLVMAPTETPIAAGTQLEIGGVLVEVLVDTDKGSTTLFVRPVGDSAPDAAIVSASPANPITISVPVDDIDPPFQTITGIQIRYATRIRGNFLPYPVRGKTFTGVIRYAFRWRLPTAIAQVYEGTIRYGTRITGEQLTIYRGTIRYRTAITGEHQGQPITHYGTIRYGTKVLGKNRRSGEGQPHLILFGVF